MTPTTNKQIAFQFIRNNGKDCKVSAIDLPEDRDEVFSLALLRIAQAREWALAKPDRKVYIYLPNLGFGKHNLFGGEFLALNRLVERYGIVLDDEAPF